MTSRSLLACSLFAALAVSPAYAGEKIDPAKQAKADVLFEKAQTLYQDGQYSASIALFQEAFDLVHDPVYLFNIAQSYRKVLDCVNAVEFYSRYLDAREADPKQRDKVNGWIRELQPCVDQRQREKEAVQRAEEAERQRRAEELARQRQATAPRGVEIDRGAPFRIAGLSLVGVGVVGFVVGGIYSRKGTQIRDELAAACLDGCNWPDLQARDDDGKSANKLAAIGWIGGGIAALAGTGLYIYGRMKIETVQLTPTEGGASVTARLSF